MKNKIIAVLATILCATGIYFGISYFAPEKKVENKPNTVTENIIETYEMTNEEIKELPTTEIIEQTQKQEENLEQKVEGESFELQGEIAYNGTKEYPKISLGSYKALTYYSQIDKRWKNKPYTSINKKSQTVGSSGCCPTSLAMVITATKGSITPDKLANIFVRYGFRSPNNGTYWSACRWVADVFNIGYEETKNVNTAIKKLKNNHYVVCSVGNGLFTTDGHYILLTGIKGNNIKIYDPYLYSGKFNTSTRRNKVTVKGSTVYCSISNFKKYANYKRFFAYKYEIKAKENKTKVKTHSYTRYVKVNGTLNVRKGASTKKAIVGQKKNGDKVTVYEDKGSWSRIGTNKWVNSKYLSSTNPIKKKSTKIKNTVGKKKTLKKATTIYSKSSLKGKKYNYKKNTKVKILKNVSNKVDKIKVISTGRKGYIKNNLYK